jgi:hypothetical protein
MDVGCIGEGLPTAVGNAYVGTAKTASRRPRCFHNVAIVPTPIGEQTRRWVWDGLVAASKLRVWVSGQVVPHLQGDGADDLVLAIHADVLPAVVGRAEDIGVTDGSEAIRRIS